MLTVDTGKMNIPKMVRYGEFVEGKIKETDEKWSPVKEKSFFESIPKKKSAISSGATTIGSAERAPGDVL
jgi:hypothetical protein